MVGTLGGGVVSSIGGGLAVDWVISVVVVIGSGGIVGWIVAIFLLGTIAIGFLTASRSISSICLVVCLRCLNSIDTCSEPTFWFWGISDVLTYHLWF